MAKDYRLLVESQKLKNAISEARVISWSKPSKILNLPAKYKEKMKLWEEKTDKAFDAVLEATREEFPELRTDDVYLIGYGSMSQGNDYYIRLRWMKPNSEES